MRAISSSVLVLVLATLVGADDTSTRIARLIQQLGSDRYVDREAANKALEAIGAPALEALEKAARDSPDPEVRLRRAWQFGPSAIGRTGPCTLDGHTACVCTVAFSPDGRRVASGG